MTLAHTQLVALSIYKTEIIDFRRSPDEFIGFPTGFLQAGAAGVVNSLWSVNDAGTALLMQQFYNKHLGKRQMEPVTVLREVQQWLRTTAWNEISGITQIG